MKSDSEFKIKFDGEQHQIDAQVLISSLIHTTTIIRELNKYYDDSKRVDIKINAPEKGSFVIHLELVESLIENVSNIFTRENIVFGSVLIGAFVNLIELKRFTKGKKTTESKSEQGKTTITNCDGSNITISNDIYNIYTNNITIHDALSRSFDVIDNDSAITGIEIIGKDDLPMLVVPKSDFSDIIAEEEQVDTNKKIVTEMPKLVILRVSFEKDLKWDFYYRGNKITAKIADKDFYTRIDKGESFAKGDTLEAELAITQVFDDGVQTYINKSYQINRIINHFKRGQDYKMSFKQ